jgi:hypothetical protein
MPRRRPPGFSMRSLHHRAADAIERRCWGERVLSAVCPVCGWRLTPRLRRGSAYFHCRCYEATRA